MHSTDLNADFGESFDVYTIGMHDEMPSSDHGGRRAVALLGTAAGV